jgi:hypothetical protein
MVTALSLLDCCSPNYESEWVTFSVLDKNHLRTAQAIQELTDRGLFELLVADILWIAEPRYRSLISTGVNSAGEPIHGLVDGFARIGGSIAHEYALLAATTTDQKNLRGKFTGDIQMAADVARRLRAVQNNAKFTVVLATNENVSAELVTDIHVTAAKEDLGLDLWDQRRLARVLEFDATGQWLRRTYFGITSTILSFALLASLSRKSLEDYAASLLTDPKALPRRAQVDRIAESIDSETMTVLAIVAESGYGKSTAAQQMMQTRIDLGNAAFWVTADQVAAAASLPSLLEQALWELNGGPIENPGTAIREMTGEINGRLLIIVDDVNRADDPRVLVRKVMQWGKMLSHSRATLPPIVLMVPLWPSVHNSIASETRDLSWLQVVELSRFVRAETIVALESIGLPRAIINDVADRLGDDPFLVGRFQTLSQRHDKALDRVALAERVLEEYLSDIERELAEVGSFIDVAMVHDTLISLARGEIDHVTLQPTVGQLRNWLPEAAAILDVALSTGKLLTRHRIQAGDEVRFRHDRLHDQLLGLAMATILEQSPEHVAIYDPFFARIAGIALTLVQAREAVESVSGRSPLAVFEGIRALGTRATPRRDLLVDLASRWVDTKSECAPSQVRRHVLSALFDADSSIVLPLTERIRDSWLRRLVRLRAGDAFSGAAYCRDEDSSFIFSDPRVENAIEHALMFHRDVLVSGAAEQLRHASDDRTRYGALTLAGWTAAPELASDVLACWHGADDRDALLDAAMWAAVCCSRANAAVVLKPMVDWLMSPREDEEKTRRNDVFYVRGRFAQRMTEDAIRALVAEAGEGGRRARLVIALLSYVDHPLVFELYLRVLGERQVEGFDLLTIDFRPHWTDRARGRPPGAASREVLQRGWSDNNRLPSVRWEAFELWAGSADHRDLAVLRSVEKSSPFYGAAIRARARLHDRSVDSEIAEEIARDDHRVVFALFDAQEIWSPKLRDAIDALLNRVSSHMAKANGDCRCDVHGFTADLLITIPDADAEQLIVSNWSSLGSSRLYLQVALFVGTPRLIQMATAQIDRFRDDEQLFEHVSHRFRAFRDRDDGLTPAHLDRLIPFAARIPEHDVTLILADAARRGWRDWIVANVSKLTGHLASGEELRKRYRPTTEELAAELRATHGKPFRWIRELERRGIPNQQAIDAAALAIQDRDQTETWLAACEVLESLGTRSDIGRFEPHLPDAPQLQNAFEGAAFELRHHSGK